MISRLLKDEDVTSEQVGEAGIPLFVILSGGKKSDSLKSFRHAKNIWKWLHQQNN